MKTIMRDIKNKTPKVGDIIEDYNGSRGKVNEVHYDMMYVYFPRHESSDMVYHTERFKII